MRNSSKALAVEVFRRRSAIFSALGCADRPQLLSTQMASDDGPVNSAVSEMTVEEYAALDDAQRAALPLTQSRRKKLEKLLVAYRKKAAKAAAQSASASTKTAHAPSANDTDINKSGQRGRPFAADSADAANYAPLETPPGERKRLSAQMAPTYQPRDVEAAWYEWWNARGFFKVDAADVLAQSDEKQADKFVMVIPPPNVTGSLHLGHALMCSIEDAIARWHRMHGRITLYVPGVDHAGIATQVVVEKELKKLGYQDRHALGREKFVEEVWKWKEEYGGKITQQMKRIGSSLDWNREEFTMSDKLNTAVKEAFVRFHDAGLIYRDTRLVNWSCVLRTAISDVEVETIELDGPTMLPVPEHEDPVEFGVLTSFAYKLRDSDSDEELVVATTRLETMLGDTAVAVHPDDKRYAHLIGRKLVHPFIPDRDMSVIADGELVDMSFGTGAVKITPAHDPNDFACSRRHGLPEIVVLSDVGCINENGGSKFAGMKRYVARVQVEKALADLGLLRGKKPNPMSLGLCSRSGDIVEPMLKPQWWVNCKELAQKSVDAVKNGELEIIPPAYKNTWYHWLNNIQDWCVSRQLWWGHRVPAYRARVEATENRTGQEAWVIARSDEEARQKAAKTFGDLVDPSSILLEQDEDVLDTWFSSGLFPFSVFGWPNETKDMEAFYPTTMLETGYDILFFWVARMVMMGLGLTGKLPFRSVCLHPMVRDKRGRKMSKSLGNVIDPLYVIEGASLQTLTDRIKESSLKQDEIERAVADKTSEFPDGIPVCGADSLRMGLLAYMTQAGDINLDVARVVGYRNFGNKLWNATRFALTNLGADFRFTHDGLDVALRLGRLADLWIMSRLNATIKATNEAFDAFRLGDAVLCVYSFWMNDFCAVYLESVKPVLRGDDEAAKAAARHVLYECLYSELRLLHPMMPFVTEELYHRLPGPKPFESIVIAEYPKPVASRIDLEAEKNMEVTKSIVQSIRGLSVEYGLKPNARPDVYLLASDKSARDALEPSYIQTLACCGSVKILTTGEESLVPTGCAVKLVNDTYEIHLALAGLVDFATEIAKLQASAADKILAIDQYKKKMCAEGYETRVPENVRARNAEILESRQKELAALQSLEKRFKSLLHGNADSLED